MNTSCKKCFSVNKLSAFQSTSYLSTLLVILIPKCPFCIMAYSSAITVCGAQDIYMSSNNWVSFVPLLLSGVIIIIIALNNKGTRTFFSILIALIGFLLVLFTHQLILTPDYYNWGAMLLIVAVWVNGNFVAFVSEAHRMYKKIKWSWQK